MAHDADEPAGTTPSGPMRVLERGVYRGPHVYGPTPMVRVQLDLGALEAWPTDRLPGFTDRLLAMLPGLRQHGCCFREPGGLVRRLEEGTWLGHVAEHVALELQSRAGSPVTRGKTRSVRGREGVYNVMYAFREERPALLAGRLALALVDSLLPPELQGVQGLDLVYRDGGDEPASPAAGRFDPEAALAALTRLVRRCELGPTTRSLVREAERRGIPVTRLDDRSLVQLGHGRHQRRLRASITGTCPHVAVEAASDKDLTKALLKEAGVPVPRGAVVRDAEEAVRAAERLGCPVVTKPLDGNHGRGVSIGLATVEEVRLGFEQAARHGSHVLVEEFYRGNDHRILVVGGEVVAVAERVPAHVVGDGEHSVAALIEEVNRDPRRGEGHERVMTRIAVDDHVLGLLARANFTLESVPGAGEVVHLRATANLSTGGTAVDRTDEIHPDNAAIARRAALTIGLDIAGIDFIAPDIARSVRETGGGIVEVNAAPGFRMHLEPFEGRPRDVAEAVVRMLFPHGAPSRIPVIAVTGTNGKSTTTRMVAHVLRRSGLTVGLTSTNGVYVNDERIAAWDASGPASARMVLRDPTVDAAVLETARGGILREGLAFARCDVGAVLNVQDDHLGLKGVDTLEDLARVKSVVVEAVHRDGCSVLNADDPLAAGMADRAGGRVAFFSLRGGEDMPAFLRRHVEEGGLAVVREPTPDGGELVVHHDERRLPLMRAAAIPATLGGLGGVQRAERAGGDRDQLRARPAPVRDPLRARDLRVELRAVPGAAERVRRPRLPGDPRLRPQPGGYGGARPPRPGTAPAARALHRHGGLPGRPARRGHPRGGRRRRGRLRRAGLPRAAGAAGPAGRAGLVPPEGGRPRGRPPAGTHPPGRRRVRGAGGLPPSRAARRPRRAHAGLDRGGVAPDPGVPARPPARPGAPARSRAVAAPAPGPAPRSGDGACLTRAGGAGRWPSTAAPRRSRPGRRTPTAPAASGRWRRAERSSKGVGVP
jgi:cyanophycin synthetase